MPKLTNGSPGRLTICVLGAAFAMATTVPAMAEPSGSNAPAAQNTGQGMGAMKQQMQQQMRQCMDQMPPMSGTDQNAMRQRMMERMHGCMEQMMSSHHCGAMKEGAGPDQGTEQKPDAHDHSGKDAGPDH
jgi:TolA-binding protein